jgi:post-segregation antitoxin (ccd killing protein)
MARINVYVPDELADAARAASLNISSLTQQAIRRELDHSALQQWLSELKARRPIEVSTDDVVAAVDASRDELGRAAD